MRCHYGTTRPTTRKSNPGPSRSEQVAGQIQLDISGPNTLCHIPSSVFICKFFNTEKRQGSYDGPCI